MKNFKKTYPKRKLKFSALKESQYKTGGGHLRKEEKEGKRTNQSILTYHSFHLHFLR